MDTHLRHAIETVIAHCQGSGNREQEVILEVLKDILRYNDASEFYADKQMDNLINDINGNHPGQS